MNPPPTAYAIVYDADNTGSDLDFFWSKEARDAKLKEIMDERIKHCRARYQDETELMAACTAVEQQIAGGEIEAAFYSNDWRDVVKDPDDNYYLYDSEIPDHVLNQHHRITELETALKAMMTDSAPFMKAEWGGGGLPYKAEHMTQEKNKQRSDLAWSLARKALNLSTPPPISV